MSTQVGDKFILWQITHKDNAYTDQMGISHEATVVLGEVHVTITEVRLDVPGEFTDRKFEGWKATSSTGEEFTCNWERFPDASMMPTFMWDRRHDGRGRWSPFDALQAYKSHLRPLVTPDGQRAIPTGTMRCEKHDSVFLPGDEIGCPDCWDDQLDAKQ